MKKATVHTLGCRLNQSESSIIEKALQERGYQLTSFKDSSDLAIINTCTVTAKADSDCRQAIRSYIRRNPKAFVAVIGCYSQISYKQVAEIHGVDLIMGNQDKLDVVNYVSLEKNKQTMILRDRFIRSDFTIDYVGQSLEKTRANLKIQDGCDFICSFCIIPKARGRARAREWNNTLNEAKVLVEKGFEELILTGVNVGTYLSPEGKNIVDLVNALNEISQLKRIRISSIEPTTIPIELFHFMKDTEHKLLPYLHIPLQSASDSILARMKRKYTRQEYSDFIQKAYETIPNLCLGTDVLVGMPGETDELFTETYDFLEKSPINYFHTFSFSAREGTLAYNMDDKVHDATIKRRASLLRRLSEYKKQNFYTQYLGKNMNVLFEQYKDGINSGYTENYIRVALSSEKDFSRQIVNVSLEKVLGDCVWAK